MYINGSSPELTKFSRVIIRGFHSIIKTERKERFQGIVVSTCFILLKKCRMLRAKEKNSMEERVRLRVSFYFR